MCFSILEDSWRSPPYICWRPDIWARSEDTVAFPGPSRSFGLPEEDDDSRLVKKEKRQSDGPEKEEKFAETLFFY